MSVSSFEGSPLPVDLPTKYQKLATEYAKLRAQVGVLKKAVVDEQMRCNELKDTLRVRDQNYRKAEQELESLNFRNQQLTIRVTVLQEDLDALQNTSKKSRSKTQPAVKNPVFEEELQKKITENAHLALLVQEQSENFEQEKFALIQQNQSQEHEIKEYKRVLSMIEQSKSSKCDMENKVLLQRLHVKEEEVQQLCKQISSLRGLSNTNKKKTFPLTLSRESTQVLYSLPVCDVIKSLIQFCNSLQLWIQSINRSKGSLNLLNELIVKNQSYLEEFATAFNSIKMEEQTQQVTLEVDKIIPAIEKYIANLDGICSVKELRTDTEMSKIIREILTAFKKHYIQLVSALQICLLPSVSCNESDDFMNQIAGVFRSVRSTCDYFSSALSDKVSSNESCRDVEIQILSSLSNLGSSCGRFYKKITENSSILRESIERETWLTAEVFESPLPATKKVHEDKTQTDPGSDYWKQEYELLKLSHSKKLKDMEEQILSLSGTTTPTTRSSTSSNIAQTPTEGKSTEAVDFKNIFGSLTAPWAITLETESHDSEIKKYFTCRTNTHVADKQQAESKMSAFKAECGALQKRLEHSLECRLVLEASMKQAHDAVGRLQEELTTTSSSYELQLSSMSEHMANMNVTLASQAEEIEQLRYELTTKDSKKGRQK